MTRPSSASDTPPVGKSARFQTTRWSIIADAANGSGPDQRDALEELCRSYWQPVYVFVRRSGFSAPEAEDLTQDFFADLVQRGPLIESADRTQGKFRTYLLAAVKNRIANHHRDAAAIKRGGDVQFFSIDAAAAERRYDAEPASGWTAEALFHRRWALTLLDRVLQRLADSYERSGRKEWFESLRPFLTTGEKPAHDELAKRLETTASAVRVSIHRLRKQYRDALAAEIATTLGEDQSVADERGELLRSLTGD